MDSRSDSAESCDQWKHDKDPSKSEKFLIFIFHSSKKWSDRYPHAQCRMIGGETTAG